MLARVNAGQSKLWSKCDFLEEHSWDLSVVNKLMMNSSHVHSTLLC